MNERPPPPRRRLRRHGPGWPPGLENLEQPPAALWLLGSAGISQPSVAIVGSRRATHAGLAIARELGRDLGRSGVQVVSGFARGIDAAAHEGALEGGGTTLAVLGCGLDQDYPRGQERLRREVAAAGALLTEYDDGVPPEGWRFPRRNRLIAALAAVVVVVEASERSGALSTARWALDLGREVLAVPGSIRSDRSRGSNALIRDGARPCLGCADVLEALGLGRPQAAGAPGRSPAPQLELPLREVLDRLSPDPVHPDDLGETLGLPPHVLAARLTDLELRGAIRVLPGGLVSTS